VHEYDGNGGNGTRAYLATHPKCVTIRGAAVGASRLLRNAKVRGLLETLQRARWKRLQMSGDEALALVAGDARADLRELYDDHGTVLNPRDWPDSVARSVKSYRTGLGGASVTLNDQLAARRMILEQTGTLKNPLGKVATSLAKILAGDFSEDDDQ
jgi:hypothetical protein